VPTEKTRDELVKVARTESEIFTADQGRTYLEKNGYLTPGTMPTLPAIALILLQLIAAAGKIPKPIAEGIRAAALMLEEAQVGAAVEELVKRTLEGIAPTIQQLTEATEKTKGAVEDLESATIANTATLEEFRQETHELNELIQSAVTDFTEKIDNIEGMKQGPTDDGTQTASLDPQQLQERRTYATAARTPPPLQHAEVFARSQGRDKQVLIDCLAGQGAEEEQGQQLNERELVKKANMSVELMGIQAEDKPDDGDLFVGAQRLRRGGILYLMKSTEAANWLRKTDVRKAFLDHFGGTFQLRDKGHSLIIEYVPVRFDPNSQHALREIEITNGLTAGEILGAKYLKDPVKRNPGQQTAFVGLLIKSPATANKILRSGVVIEGKHVFGRKDIQEPKRCMKCQEFKPHIAANCPAIHDTCAQCSSIEHRTKDCEARPDQTRCSNCRTNGHAASSRQCPIFIRESAKLAQRRPENRYKYIPVVDDPSTWELLNEPMTEGQTSQEDMARIGRDYGTDWRTTEQPIARDRDRTTRGRWAGGPRGAGHRGGGAGRGRDPTFVPPQSDVGWNTRARVTAPQMQTGRATRSQQGPTQGQTILDTFFPSTNPTESQPLPND
jgi:hypothetical protein